MPDYWNAAGQSFPLPERPLEPPDCWGPQFNHDDQIDEEDEEIENEPDPAHREITL